MDKRWWLAIIPLAIIFLFAFSGFDVGWTIEIVVVCAMLACFILVMNGIFWLIEKLDAQIDFLRKRKQKH